ncbi:MAG: hypothetical protein IPK82_30045 [Polyangiaceae bacterium]|nr:hypothetical protein [Polyangiaceae bacterium]
MKATGRPALADRRLWETRHNHYVNVLCEALSLLRRKDSLPEDELELNRELWFCILTARRGLDPSGRFPLPVPEGQNLPDPNAAATQPHDRKKPDFQWIHDDPQEPDPRYGVRSFAVECKRLGKKTEGGLVLNKEYIDNGALRFRSPEYRYSHYLAEGAMIGYVQTMDPEAIHSEVCQQAATAQLPILQIGPEGWKPQATTQLAHRFQRPFPRSPFDLTHLWLDIRDMPVRATGPGKQNKPETRRPRRKRR